MVRFELRLAPSAERSLQRLPEFVAVAVVEFVTGPVLENPHRAGKPLVRELAGYHFACRGDYRMDVYRPR